MAGMLYLGTSGFSYDQWKHGVFYPEGLKTREMLAFYASRFPSVEINYTFRRFPTPKSLETWRAETPETFRFTLKANQRITHWKRLELLNDAALVECRLETGRTHQVRVHMASIGHPLVGDPVYGRGKTAHRKLLNQLDFKRQALHAAYLGFIHPVTKGRLSFDSALPSDMQELFTALGV